MVVSPLIPTQKEKYLMQKKVEIKAFRMMGTTYDQKIFCQYSASCTTDAKKSVKNQIQSNSELFKPE